MPSAAQVVVLQGNTPKARSLLVRRSNLDRVDLPPNGRTASGAQTLFILLDV